MRCSAAICLALALAGCSSPPEEDTDVDTIKTSTGDLEITFVGHGTLMFSHGGKVIHVDPWTKLADYSALPKADVVLITHDHFDHLDAEAIAAVRKDGTEVIVSRSAGGKVPGGVVMTGGDSKTVAGIRIEAVPAYNLIHRRENGQPYHPRGDGNGYVITFGDKRVYVAGDTEDTPEMKSLTGLDCAFLPMNLPYTMTPEMVAAVAKAMKPAVLYPYHFGESDTGALVKLLEGSGIDVRIREMK